MWIRSGLLEGSYHIKKERIRKRLKLKKGDMVIFKETETVVMIRPAEGLVS
jgi:hypothetical protein